MATNLLLRRYQYMIQTSGLNYHKQIARALGSSQEFLNILAGVPSSTGTVGGDDGHDQPNPAFQRWDALAYERETFVLGEEAKASGSPAKQRVHEVMVAPQRAEAMEKAMAAAPKSIWLWGPPGSGKHFVMDMTFDAVPKEIRKVRYSFPTFMQLIHETSKELLARGEDSEGDDGDDECHDAQMDPVPHLVRAISDTTDALFLEDFEVRLAD
jgi:predicted ATPase